MAIRKLGAYPVLVEVFDAEALATAVLDARELCGKLGDGVRRAA
jgi:hypothetical protein